MADDDAKTYVEFEGRRKALQEAVNFAAAAMPVVGAISPQETVGIARVFLPFLTNEVSEAPATPHREPAVPIEESVQPDYLVCLDDGHRVQMLKRHIAKLGYTPASYRTYWGLADDYPMTCANYSATRSALAKQIGLGIRARRRVAAE